MKNSLLTAVICALSILKLFAQDVVNDLTFSDDTISGGFNPSYVYTCYIQPDGRILIGGSFNYAYGEPVGSIIRLNADGSLDPTFDTGTGIPSQGGVVSSFAMQNDGKILVAGFFNDFNGNQANSLIRLNTDGSLDASFSPATSPGNEIRSVVLQPDGKILIGGWFEYFNSGLNNGLSLARLNTDGSADVTFNVAAFSSSPGVPTIEEIELQNDGKIVVAGYFSNYNGSYAGNIVRLNSNGSIDPSFATGSGFNGWLASVGALEIQADGKILAVGDFTSFAGTARSGIARLNADGSLDSVFDPGSGFPPGGLLNDLKIQNDGKILVAGYFSNYNGSNAEKIIRLNSNGSIDPSFATGSGFNGSVYTLGIQTDGKILAGGGFTAFRDVTRYNFTRLRTDCDNSLAQTQSITVSTCAPYISPSNQSYMQSGTYYETTYSNIGCDSIVLTINLDILPTTYGGWLQDEFCVGSVYTWNNIEYTMPGNYQQTLTNYLGCDSIVGIMLSHLTNDFNPTFSSTQQLYTAPPFAAQFSNSTANSSNYSFVWYWGDGTSTTSNNASVFHEYLYNGLYTVSLVATDNVTGCTDTTTITDYIYCTGGASCTHTAAISQQGPIQACEGTDVWLTCNNDPSFSYQWRRDGVNIPGNNNDSLLVTQTGNYTVSIYVNNCPVTSNGVAVTITPLPAIPVITTSGNITSCFGGILTLNAPVGSTSYSWNTGATTASISVTQSGNYTVTVTNASGCARTSAPYTVNASFMQSPNVCIVGMDSLTNENRIVWEKPLTLGIDSFYVYKETNVSDVYTKIGATNYPDLAVFLDQNSNPAVQAYRYKLTVLDTCGTETLLSDFHKTIHLTINAGVGGAWNLIWSHYEGLTFGSYNIYRGTDPTNISLLTTIQSNLNSYTDLAPPVGPVYYQIEIVNPNSCDPTKVINYSVSKSNIVNNGANGINTIANSTVLVYPNPTSKDVTLEITAELIEKDYYLADNTGRIILSGQFRALKETINLEQIATGVYFIKIDDNANLTYKIVKN